MVQMTTPVNPGDCGGCVVNSKGQCIGMVNSGYQSEITEIESMGLLKLFGKDYADLLPSGPNTTSFATPASTLKFVADRIIKHGRMIRVAAGLGVRSIDDGVRTQLKIKEGQGVEITTVERNGPASKGGLKRRDIILSWDGTPVTDPRMMKRLVLALEQEKSVRVLYLRGGAPFETEVELKFEKP
jgi:S1-C subfamily serine protease